MKAILMSIRPQHVANILNGEKTIEIRKKFPKDYVGWVYIYCTKDLKSGKKALTWLSKKGLSKIKTITYFGNDILGKVVARFWCDKVEEIFTIGMYYHETKTLDKNELPRLSCLSRKDLDNYLQGENGYAIHITKLEIFDKPKEISEFSIKVFPHRKDNLMTRYLTRAPQSWCYIEV